MTTPTGAVTIGVFEAKTCISTTGAILSANFVAADFAAAEVLVKKCLQDNEYLVSLVKKYDAIQTIA